MKNIFIKQNNKFLKLDKINILIFSNFLSLIENLEKLYTEKSCFFNKIDDCFTKLSSIKISYISPLNIHKSFNIQDLSNMFNLKENKIFNFLDFNKIDNANTIEARIKIALFLGLNSNNISDVFILLDVFDYLSRDIILFQKILKIINVLSESEKHLIIIGTINNSLLATNNVKFINKPEIIICEDVWN